LELHFAAIVCYEKLFYSVLSVYANPVCEENVATFKSETAKID